jgi:amino acid transporter
MVATMTEETKNPGRDVPLGLISSMLAITLVYSAMPLALVGMQRYNDFDANTAYSVAFFGGRDEVGACMWSWDSYSRCSPRPP